MYFCIIDCGFENSQYKTDFERHYGLGRGHSPKKILIDSKSTGEGFSENCEEDGNNLEAIYYMGFTKDIETLFRDWNDRLTHFRWIAINEWDSKWNVLREKK